MLAPSLLSRLVCPATRQEVSLASDGEVASINAAISRGEMRNGAGQTVTRPVESALIRQDRQVAYAIHSNIPILLAAEGLQIGSIPLAPR